MTIPMMIMILMILLTNMVHKVKCLIITYYTCVYHNMPSYRKLWRWLFKLTSGKLWASWQHISKHFDGLSWKVIRSPPSPLALQSVNSSKKKNCNLQLTLVPYIFLLKFIVQFLNSITLATLYILLVYKLILIAWI